MVSGTEAEVRVDFGLAELGVGGRLERKTGVEDFWNEPLVGVYFGAWSRMCWGPRSAATVGVVWCLEVDDDLAVSSSSEEADGEKVFGV